MKGEVVGLDLQCCSMCVSNSYNNWIISPHFCLIVNVKQRKKERLRVYVCVLWWRGCSRCVSNSTFSSTLSKQSDCWVSESLHEFFSKLTLRSLNLLQRFVTWESKHEFYIMFCAILLPVGGGGEHLSLVFLLDSFLLLLVPGGRREEENIWNWLWPLT